MSWSIAQWGQGRCLGLNCGTVLLLEPWAQTALKFLQESSIRALYFFIHSYFIFLVYCRCSLSAAKQPRKRPREPRREPKKAFLNVFIFNNILLLLLSFNLILQFAWPFALSLYLLQFCPLRPCWLCINAESFLRHDFPFYYDY